MLPLNIARNLSRSRLYCCECRRLSSELPAGVRGSSWGASPDAGDSVKIWMAESHCESLSEDGLSSRGTAGAIDGQITATDCLGRAMMISSPQLGQVYKANLFKAESSSVVDQSQSQPHEPIGKWHSLIYGKPAVEVRTQPCARGRICDARLQIRWSIENAPCTSLCATIRRGCEPECRKSSCLVAFMQG